MGCVTSVPIERNTDINIEVVSDEEYYSSPKPSESPPQLFDTKSLPDRNYLIQILKATDLLDTDTSHTTTIVDRLSESVLYVVLKIFDCDLNKQKGNDIISLANNNLVWNCYRTFKASEFHDKLVFEIWAKDFHNKDDFVGLVGLVGSGEIKISQLFVNVYHSHMNNQDEDEDCLQEVIINLTTSGLCFKLYFKLFAMQCSPNADERKTIFFIKAEKEIEQAIQFNQDWKRQRQRQINHDLNDFLSCSIIYSSPLSCATQTAILTLLDHPCLLNKRGRGSIHHARNLRDISTNIKNIKNIENKQPTDNIIDTTLNNKINKINIETNDSKNGQKWWNYSNDTKQNFNKRLKDFMYYIRYSNDNIIICVSHSLWFKGFFKQYVNIKDISKYHHSATHIIKDMCNSKIFKEDNIDENKNNQQEDEQYQHNYNKKENMKCIRVDIAFSDNYENGLRIDDVKLLFDTKLQQQ